jgi:SAM-dependent methyltransferase
MSTPEHDQRLPARCERACAELIEDRWRRAPGLALRVSRSAPGVVERPGRTRFDLAWLESEGSIGGPLRGRWPWLPLADGAFSLVILDCLTIADQAAFVPILDEAVRVLADDGRLLVLDADPWGWLGLRSRIAGERVAMSQRRLRGMMQRAGLEDIEVDHALCWPPLPARLIERHGDALDRFGRRWWPLPGSVYSVCGRKRGSNVIAIPVARDRRHGLVAAPEGMRRAG